MRDPNRSAVRRTVSGIMGLMMLVFVLSSAFFLTAEAHHDCEGEDCPVCACMQQCENTLRGLGDGTTVQPSAVIPILCVLLTAALSVAEAFPGTPVSRKVRLNN